MLQQLIIALVVVGAMSYVTWTMMGSRLRLRLVNAISRSGIAPAWAARQRAKMSAGGCSNCAVSRSAAHPKVASK
jgi:hypothetical protein